MTGSRIDILHGRFSELAAVGGVGSIGVGTAVDRGTSCRQILPSPLGHEDHDGHHDRRHQDEAGDGDTNGKAPL